MRKIPPLSLFTVGLPTVFMCYTLNGWLSLNWYGARMYNTHTHSLSVIHTHSSLKTWWAHKFSPCNFPVAEPFSFSFSVSRSHISTSRARGPVTGRVGTWCNLRQDNRELTQETRGNPIALVKHTHTVFRFWHAYWPCDALVRSTTCREVALILTAWGGGDHICWCVVSIHTHTYMNTDYTDVFALLHLKLNLNISTHAERKAELQRGPVVTVSSSCFLLVAQTWDEPVLGGVTATCTHTHTCKHKHIGIHTPICKHFNISFAFQRSKKRLKFQRITVRKIALHFLYETANTLWR